MSSRVRFASRFATAVAAYAVAASTAGAQVTFTNSNPITIPADGAASLYPSSITVSGYTGTITAVTVTLTNFTHTYTDDLAAIVTGPGVGPYATDFGAFVGQPPDGTYSLYVYDFGAPDGGSIGSWSVTLSGVTPVPEPAVLATAAAGLGAAMCVRRRRGHRNGSATPAHQPPVVGQSECTAARQGG
jgi:hypothetical protein